MECSRVTNTSFYVLGTFISKRYTLNTVGTCAISMPAWTATIADPSCHFLIFVLNTNLVIPTQRFKIFPGSPEVFQVNGALSTNLTCGDQIWSSRNSSGAKCLIFRVYDIYGNIYNFENEIFTISGRALDRFSSETPYTFSGSISTRIK